MTLLVPPPTPAGALFGELAFDGLYLAAIWVLVAAMDLRRRRLVPPEPRLEAKLFTMAFALLALGDTGHVGMRLLAFSLGIPSLTVDMGPWQIPLVGAGALVTAITLTLFYVLMLAIGRLRAGRRAWEPVERLLLAVAVLRLLLLALPQNAWGSMVPPQPWSLLRNLPLLLLVFGVAVRFHREGRHRPDPLLRHLGALMLLSLAFHLPVVLFVQAMPALGLLMIPKTLAYLAMALFSYRSMATIEPITSR